MVSIIELPNNAIFQRTNYEGETHNTSLQIMRSEANRLGSFANWPCPFMNAQSLAKAGFYYVNKDDIVRCAFCNIEIGQWEEGDNAMSDHQRWSNDCPFVRGQNCGNIAIEVDAVPLPAGQDTCGNYGIEIRPNSMPERETGTRPVQGLNLSRLGVQPSRPPAYSSYTTFESRMDSFEEWPRSMKQKPEELAAAGFFYNGKGDQTICFHCGGGLKDWEDDDNPWEQHAKWFSKCNFVYLQKGPEYISEICSKQTALLTRDEAAAIYVPPGSFNINPVHAKPDSSCASAACSSGEMVTKPKDIKAKELASDDSKNSNSNTMCKICYLKEVGIVFLPCGHIVACVDCASALSTCAVCRKPLEATVRAFLS